MTEQAKTGQAMTGIWSKMFIAALVAGISCAPAIAATCEISPQSVSFGNYDTLAAQPLDGVGNISVVCDVETTFTISLDSGTGSYAARRMISGTQNLQYNLYTDASRLVIWGDGNAGSATVTNTGTIIDETIYGRVAASQYVAAGIYSDTMVVTVSY